MCDLLNNLSIYDPIGRSLGTNFPTRERPILKFLKKLMRTPKEPFCNSAEKQNFAMDAEARASQLPRTQINQSRPQLRSIRQPSRTAIARILGCLRHHGSHDPFRFRTGSERNRSPPQLRLVHEDRIDQLPDNVSRRLDFSRTPTTPRCRTENSKISFHRDVALPERLPVELLYPTDSGSSSRQTSDTEKSLSEGMPVHFPRSKDSGSSSRQDSDIEFFDARGYFSPDESEKASLKKSRPSLKASILRRCKCMTCKSVIQELGWPVNYRIAEVCNAVDRGTSRVRMNFDVRVAKYDIRSGNIIEEWEEELNLSERVIPIGCLKNADIEEDLDIRGSRARSTLKSLFSADKRVRSEEEFENFYDDESVDDEGTDEFAPFALLDNVDGLEPRTSRFLGMR